MARYVGELTTERPIDEVFAYISDFSNAQEWDPGTVRAQRLEAGPVAVGSRVALRASVLGRESDIEYVVSELDPPRLVLLRGENSSVVSLDRITLSSDGRDTVLTYEADLRLKRLGALLDPILALILRRLGEAALDSLRGVLAAARPLLADPAVHC
jgi:carbon monoxide dehydrogenase subunit G